MCDFGLARF
jgi:serine/threonine protein kinase